MSLLAHQFMIMYNVILGLGLFFWLSSLCDCHFRSNFFSKVFSIFSILQQHLFSIQITPDTPRSGPLKLRMCACGGHTSHYSWRLGLSRQFLKSLFLISFPVSFPLPYPAHTVLLHSYVSHFVESYSIVQDLCWRAFKNHRLTVFWLFLVLDSTQNVTASCNSGHLHPQSDVLMDLFDLGCLCSVRRGIMTIRAACAVFLGRQHEGVCVPDGLDNAVLW